jgi:hypothetical protein
MRTRSAFLISFAVAVGLIAAGCGGDSAEPVVPTPPVASSAPVADTTPPPPADTTPPPADTTPATPPPPPKKVAKEIVVVGSTWGFSLSDSPNAKKAIDDECAKKKKQDKIDACTKEKSDAAANDGVRIEKDDKGNMVWITFGQEKGKEVVRNKIPFSVKDAADDSLTIAASDKDSGKKPMKIKKGDTIKVEVPDESTIAITPDDKTGRLVFKKKLARTANAFAPPSHPS